MGAWIEIEGTSDTKDGSGVAPLVGAWIEILIFIGVCFSTAVAPLVGAWIEMSGEQNRNLQPYRRSPCGSVD